MSRLENHRRIEKAKSKIRKWAYIGTTVAALAAGYLTWDTTTKREALPERDVIIRAKQQVSLLGGEEKQDEYNIDRNEHIELYYGNVEGGPTKQEDIMGTSERQVTDDLYTYHLKDNKNRRIANSGTRNEVFQSGWSTSGAVNYQEQYAVIEPENESNIFTDRNQDAFISYRIEPERALDEVEIHILRKDGKLDLKTRLVESRSFGLGWAYGKNYRAGTQLEKYTADPSDEKNKRLFELIGEYNKRDIAADNSARVKILEEILELESKIDKVTIYDDYEDGFVDWDFQESSKYLGHKPSVGTRIGMEVLDFLEQLKGRATFGLWPKAAHFDGFIRVENHYDFFPGNIPGLNKLRYDNGSNRIFSLFDKSNNGGYEIIDNVGTIGRIDIEDFWLNYDTDLLYRYYLDLDGNGSIDEDKELIGDVVVRTTYGQKEENAGQVIGKGMQKRNISYTFQYSFMAGHRIGQEERYKDFLLCAYLESMIPDQLNRGYGKHSRLGFVNEVRSDIILFNDRTYENLSRALTEENTLVADRDIYQILKATKRPYADDFARPLKLLPESTAAPSTAPADSTK
jgi:hypothetical protein